MADRIMSRGPRTNSSNASAQTASDVLENKLEQLHTLLWCCYGSDDGWFEEVGPAHRENLVWLASDLAQDAKALYQEVGPIG
ncbi:hypothetical protein [Variovorax sp. 770b2]|uniref:hypothetical protein n=1 Tax=Variovorax sp. 770b2 TaxID=1566271 RepID=UPI00210C58AA|nr:hypothetical protein [Variovorax sp. 770b2]